MLCARWLKNMLNNNIDETVTLDRIKYIMEEKGYTSEK